MVNLGSGRKREIPDIMLSRYAYYLIAQNGMLEKRLLLLLRAILPCRQENRSCLSNASQC